MKTIAVTALCVLLAVPVVAQHAQYWIPIQDCSITRQGDLSHVWTYTGIHDLVMEVSGPEYACWEYHAWVSESELGLDRQYYPGMHPSEYGFDPPLIVLDLPLTTGKTWTSESVRTRLDGPSAPKTYILNSTVVGPRSVDTVVGPLDVIEVLETVTVVGISEHTNTRFLHPQFGDVHELIDAENCGVTVTEERTWSAVKGQYR